MDAVSKRQLDRSRLQVVALHDQDNNADLENTTPAERIGMMWQLALDAWAFMGEPVAEPGLPRHIVRVLRREG
jgi:hypothetical protein